MGTREILDVEMSDRSAKMQSSVRRNDRLSGGSAAYGDPSPTVSLRLANASSSV